MTESKQNKFFYGWIIVAISTLALLISNGLSIGGLPVFYKPIQEDLLALGTVTPQTKDAVTGLAAGLTFLLAGIFSFIVGIFIKKISLRWLMAVGCIILGGGLVFYSFAGQPRDVYLSHSMFGIALGMVGVMIQTVLISNWFRRNRGLAMGIVLTGTSLGGASIPLVATPLIQSYGWRNAIVLLSILVWLVLLPAVIFFVRDKASDEGFGFDGDELIEKDAFEKKPELEGFTFGEALRSPVFWILGLCAALIFYPIFTISQQFNLYIQNNIGVSAETASFAQSMLFVTSVGGKFLFGFLADRFPTRLVIMACCGIMFLSTLMLLGFLTSGTILVFLLPFGLGYGGTFVLIQILTVESFGLKDIGKILGLITVIETVGGFVGSVMTGRLASMNNGDYTLAFYAVTVAAGLAFLATFAVNYFLKKRNVMDNF